MSEHFICDEMLDAGERAEKQAEELKMSRRDRAMEVFLVMREIERLALMGGNHEGTIH